MKKDFRLKIIKKAIRRDLECLAEEGLNGWSLQGIWDLNPGFLMSQMK